MKKAILFSTMLLMSAASQADQFLLFGEAGKYFAVHLNNGQPNYSQVLSISQPQIFVEPVCHFRSCGDATAVPLDESKLPMVLTTDPGPLKENDFVGDFLGVSAKVQKVIYGDDNLAK